MWCCYDLNFCICIDGLFVEKVEFIDFFVVDEMETSC